MSLNHFTGRLCDLFERKQNTALHIFPWLRAHLDPPTASASMSGAHSALTMRCSSPRRYRSLRSTHLMVLLFCLKPQGFSQDKEQDFCPGSKLWDLVPNILCSHMLQCNLLPHAHLSNRLITVATGHLHVFLLPGMPFPAQLSSNNSYSSLSPHLHITLQGTWPPTPLRSCDYILVRDHVILHDITEHSYNSTTLIWWLLVQSLSPVNSCLL